MQLNYYIKDNELYHKTGSKVIADANGIIEIEIDGQQRKFILEKFIAYLQSSVNKNFNQAKIKAYQQPKKRGRKTGTMVKPTKEKKERKRGWKLDVNPDRNSHRRIPVISIAPDGVEKLHVSREAAARELNLGRVNIFRVLNDTKKKVKGYSFKTA